MKTIIRIENDDINVLKNGDDFELKIKDDFSLLFSHDILVKFSEHLKAQDKKLILKNPSSDMKIFQVDLLTRLKEQFATSAEGRSDSFKAGVNNCIAQIDTILES